MPKIKEIIKYLESFAPLAYQEGYDNAGLLTGNKEEELTGVLICLDSTEEVVDEAIAKDCNLILAHHPIIFQGLKQLTGRNYVERTVIKAIKNDICIYACHTNLDHVALGVNRKIAEKLQLQKLRVLSPMKRLLNKLTTFIPEESTAKVLTALHDAGAGNIGNYRNCSFRSSGKGTFQPEAGADPYIGALHQIEEVAENRVEVIFPAHLSGEILAALKDAHPYEEVAYYIQTTENVNQEVGAGMVGELAHELDGLEFLKKMKQQLGLEMVRHTRILPHKIRRVAVCGGAGSFLLPDAIRAGADVFITSDYKYHQFFDAENKITIADIGHYESEVCTKELFYEILIKKFTNIALNLSEKVTNPISYL